MKISHDNTHSIFAKLSENKVTLFRYKLCCVHVVFNCRQSQVCNAHDIIDHRSCLSCQLILI